MTAPVPPIGATDREVECKHGGWCPRHFYTAGACSTCASTVCVGCPTGRHEEAVRATAAQPRRLRGTFLQAGDGSWFWAPQGTAAAMPPPAPVEGQLLRPLGEEVVFGFDGSENSDIFRAVRPSRWVDAYTGTRARGGPR